MPLTKHQKEVAECNSRFRVLVTGRRFGKTFLAIRELARFAIKPKQNVWYVAPTYRMCKQIVWNELKDKLIKINWIEETNEQELCVTLRNKSKIILKGADNYDSLRGVGLNFVVLDEFAYIKEAAWFEVLRPTLADTKGHALFVGTPRGQSSWSYELFNRGKDTTQKEWKSWRFKTVDGEQVTEEEVEQAKQDLDDRTFKQEFLGSFVTYSGQVYYNFNREKHVKRCNITEGTLHIGMDFNIEPMCAVVFQTDGSTVKVVNEIVLHTSNTDEIAEEIKNRYENKRIIIYPDPACRQRRTSAGGRTDLSILQNAGFSVKCKYRHPEIRDRINAVNSRLQNSDGEVLLYIDPRCKRTIHSLERQLYKQESSVPDKDSGYDHMNDALGYAIEYLFPVKNIVNFEQPRRWS